MPDKQPPVCDYEGSDYQTRFWEKGGREYEDRCEAIALKNLLPHSGKLMLELGAGAGGEIDDGALEADDVLLIGLVDDGDDEAVFESDGDADVDLVVEEDVGALDGSVEEGEGAESLSGGAGDEGEEGENDVMWGKRRGGGEEG